MLGLGSMRTTITFADDVAALVAQRRAEAGAGTSEIVNELIRAGATAARRAAPPPAVPSFDLGLSVDVSNVAEALDLLDDR